MQLFNYTNYKTADLRRFFLAGLKAAGADDRQTTITVRATRGPCRGLAACPGHWIRMWLPKDGTKHKAIIARVFDHEVAHNLGVRHGEMDPSVRSCGAWNNEVSMPAWAEGLELRQKDPRPKKKSRAERVAERAAHARQMLEKWERKHEVAKRQIRRWRTRVRYYERRGVGLS